MEREFRGFGMVEQIDSEHFENFILNESKNVVEQELFQPPVRTVTWYHTGFFFNEENILTYFDKEYSKGQHELSLSTDIIDNPMQVELSAIDYHEIARACKGIMLRQEIYANDGSELQTIPYSVSTNNCLIKVLQPKGENKFGVFFNHVKRQKIRTIPTYRVPARRSRPRSVCPASTPSVAATGWRSP